MSFILHPIQYAVQRTVNAVLKTPEHGARVTGLSADDGQATRVNLQHEALAFDPDRGFRPVYWTKPKRPRDDTEAQLLYNHIRTLAWYSDSLPILSSWLPFSIGLDAIVGFIPYLGDAIGMLVGLYIVFLVMLFGVPLRIVGIMILLVAIDTVVGAVPFIGDAIDVAFKSNIYILHLFEHHLVQTKGKCNAGDFHVIMPPSSKFMIKHPKRATGVPPFPAKSRPVPPPSAQTQQASSSGVQYTGWANEYAGRASATTQQSQAGPSSLPAYTETSAEPSSSRGGSRRNPPRMAPAPVDACELPAMPLSLPAEFMKNEEPEIQQRDLQHSGTDPLSPLATPTDEHPQQHRPQPMTPNNRQGRSTRAAEGVDSETDADEDAPLLVPSFVGPASPRGVTVVGRSRSRSRNARAARGVSWHVDISGGLSDDLEHDAATSRHLRRFSHHQNDSLSHHRSRKARYLMIYSAIFAIAYVTSLDSNSGYLYLNFACSEFGALASFSTVAICQQLVNAVAKPPIAKLSDVFGRGEALVFALVLYAGGYSIVATCQSLQGLIGGIVLQSAGATGVQVLQSIIIADLTTAKWRGLVISIVNLPYLINFAVAGPLVDAVMSSAGWRAGYGLWIIVVPLAATPLVLVLLIGQRQARNAGLLERPQIFGRGCMSAISQLCSEIDAFGLLLFTLAWVFVLGPLTGAGHGSAFPKSLTTGLIALGCSLIGIFFWWETRAANPIMPLRFLKNRGVVCTCLIGILDFASFYLSWTYLSAFVQIVKGWGQTQTGYFATTQNVTSTLTGILVGSLMACTRRFKGLLVFGVIIRLVGVSLMIRYRNAQDPTVMLVLCQLLQGIGGGSVAITMQIAAQICVRHADVAIVTALELLTAEIGAAMGSASAGLIFTTLLPGKLASKLPEMDSVELHEVYGSLSKVLSYPMGTAERTAIGEAWTETMRELCIVATLILLPTIPLAIAIPDYMLPDSHRKSRSGNPASVVRGRSVSAGGSGGGGHHYHNHHHHHRHSSASQRDKDKDKERERERESSSQSYRTLASPHPYHQQQQQNDIEELTSPPSPSPSPSTAPALFGSSATGGKVSRSKTFSPTSPTSKQEN